MLFCCHQLNYKIHSDRDIRCVHVHVGESYLESWARESLIFGCVEFKIVKVSGRGGGETHLLI